ncbi:hypothetical protein Prudu_011024, partial [Prunus dulcis]
HIMGSSNENEGAWSMMEDVSLCEAWVQRLTTIEAEKILAARLYKHKCGLVLLAKGKKVSTIPIVGRW